MRSTRSRCTISTVQYCACTYLLKIVASIFSSVPGTSSSLYNIVNQAWNSTFRILVYHQSSYIRCLRVLVATVVTSPWSVSVCLSVSCTRTWQLMDTYESFSLSVSNEVFMFEQMEFLNDNTYLNDFGTKLCSTSLRDSCNKMGCLRLYFVLLFHKKSWKKSYFWQVSQTGHVFIKNEYL